MNGFNTYFLKSREGSKRYMISVNYFALITPFTNLRGLLINKDLRNPCRH
jgi:hypothetical protein